jgi:glycosyltransferase involved in cell wall biosynthesis
MRIWLINVGEPLPINSTNERLHRTGIIANALIKKRHKIIWWTSTFDHVRKEQRFNKDTNIKVSSNFEIKLLHSIGYRKNISIFRFINHYLIGCKFYKYAQEELRPDIILSSLPTLKLSLSAVKYGEKMNIPVVLDMRDMWPEVFLDFIPSWAKGMARILFLPMYIMLSKACIGATHIIGITPGFVNWGVKCANRNPISLDKSFPLGYKENAPKKKDIEDAEQFWAKYGLSKNSNEFNICFFGNLGHSFVPEFINVINAAKEIKNKDYPIRFIICGSGVSLDFYKKKSEGCNNIIFPGWVNEAQIWTLLRMSSVGLLPYQNSKSFVISLPNKSIEYLSAGVPIVSSLKGVLGELLRDYNCGITYESENANDLASTLINLFNHPELLEEMSKNAYALYKDKFIAEKVYNDMINYLEYVSSIYLKDKA